MLRAQAQLEASAAAADEPLDRDDMGAPPRGFTFFGTGSSLQCLKCKTVLRRPGTMERHRESKACADAERAKKRRLAVRACWLRAARTARPRVAGPSRDSRAAFMLRCWKALSLEPLAPRRAVRRLRSSTWAGRARAPQRCRPRAQQRCRSLSACVAPSCLPQLHG